MNSGGATCRFAWDGISFLVPEHWNLAVYQLKRKYSRVEFDDDYGIRLEAEWVRPKRELDVQIVQKRYDKTARKLNQDAQEISRIENLPEEWIAVLYVMPTAERLLTAFYLGPDSELFCFLIMRFEPEDREDPREIIATIAESFRCHRGATVPWVLYDISLETPAELRLVNTDFQTGKKLMVFQWQLRRLYLWQVSLADLILKKHPLETWSADLLNMCRLIKGPIFSPGPDGELTWKRRRRHRFGHYDEITRWCFHYQLDTIHDREHNRLIVWLYSYRKPEDLRLLERVKIDSRPLMAG